MVAASHRITTGRILTEADLDAIADEVEATDYDITTLRKRRSEPPRVLGRLWCVSGNRCNRPPGTQPRRDPAVGAHQLMMHRPSLISTRH